MSHRSRLHKKHFSSCGHKGFGQYCHCCADMKHHKQTMVSDLPEVIVAKRRILRDQWLKTYEQDIIDLRNLPKSIVLRARQILEQLAQGVQYYKLHGKRLLGVDRDLIRIPVTRRYRLLIKDIGNNTFEVLKVLSHEAYNAIAHRGL